MRIETAQLRLLTWFSPGFPTGAFGYSHGLETAIREGRVTGAAGLQGWIAALMEHGSSWTDAVLFRLAWEADGDALAEVAELAEALAPSLERHKETMALGAAFAKAVTPWLRPTPPHSASLTAPPQGGGGGSTRSAETEGAFGAALPYPVAAGSACAAAAIPLECALTAFLQGFAANLVSVAARTIPIGQSEAVRLLAALEPATLATAARAAVATEADLGACAFLSDIAAMRHETLQPRLFIS